MTTLAGSGKRIDTNTGNLSERQIDALRDTFESKPRNRVSQNAVTKTPIEDVALDRSVVTSTDFSFSTRLDDWDVTNQKASGRCWLFAALNLFRVGAMKKMNLKEFEFSQNYMFFWDKFERANYFLEQIINTVDRPLDDRVPAFLLDRPLDDGGQWNMFVNIVSKHGLVPQSAMPETESSSHSRRMNAMVIHKLREGAKVLRDIHASGARESEIRAAKDEILEVVWRMLCIHLGTPPKKFDWQWEDKDKKFHRDGEMTPREFAAKYVDIDLEEYVCVVNDPRESSPRGRMYTVECLGNVVGGGRVLYLNVEMDMIKSITQEVLESGEPVWFGCDVGKQMQRQLGLWDRDLYAYSDIYDAEFTLDKAGRLDYHETLMTHAMLFTGVDVVDGKPRRWRVENSWGSDKSGRKGFYTMNDSWFDEHMFEIACHRSRLPKELQAVLSEEPTVLPPWDPMGSLAQ